ncbi:MAG TPA: type II toxin-antitoxin system HicA family toxin [Candidatus Binatia bacterium]|nr:type II toxin-antitoxin system HicA family toxin [Candidatus Binatia bacterium]
MRPITGKEMCRLLQQNGWILKRIRGSHHIFSKPGQVRIIVVPVHGSTALKPGLAARLSKDTGITW